MLVTKVYAFARVTDANGNWQDGSDQNAFVYVYENVSGVVEMQKIDMPAILFR